MQLRRCAAPGIGDNAHPMGAEAVRENVRHIALRWNLHIRIALPRAAAEEIDFNLDNVDITVESAP